MITLIVFIMAYCIARIIYQLNDVEAMVVSLFADVFMLELVIREELRRTKERCGIK